MSQMTKPTDSVASVNPRKFVFSKRVVFSFLVIPLLPGATAIIIGGLIDYHDVQYAFLIGSAISATGLNYLILPITLIVLLKKGVQGPIRLTIAVGLVYGGLFQLLALFGFVKFSVFNVLIYVAMGGVSGLLFWVMGIWQRKSPSDQNLAS